MFFKNAAIKKIVAFFFKKVAQKIVFIQLTKYLFINNIINIYFKYG